MARPRQFDEERVLLAVRDQFWQSGYAATSLEDLMRVTGLGKGSLYAAFGDKHQLFLRALRGYADAGHGRLRDMLATTPRALDALRAFVMAAVRDDDPAGAQRGCLMANSTCELATADADLRAASHQHYESITATIAEGVTRAQKQGDIPADADPIETARTLLTAQQGIVFMGRTGMKFGTLVAVAHTLAQNLLPGQIIASDRP
jgi:TetR/AcrR family transcriptional repressor of nem operon